jgi:Ribonuclease G/E
MKGKVRIRGIYATALTYLFSSLSYEIVQQSLQIAERLMQEVKNLPADITIKDSEDKGRIIVMGNNIIYDDLISIFKYSFIWKSPVKLYSVIENIENCTYMNFKVNPCIEEGLVVKVSEDQIIVSEVKAVSKYAMVWRGKGITTFSEHINEDDEKLKLLTLSKPLNRKGYNVKWRSNAKFANMFELKEDLERLVLKYENKDFKDQGEDFYLITLSLPDKLHFDEIRGKITNTVKYHHMLKMSYGKEVDLVEENRQDSLKLMENLITDFMEIEHIKANGQIIHLKGGKVLDKSINQNEYKITLKRYLKENGILDGIGKKIEYGDYDIVEYNSNKWYQIHKYYDANNNLKGIYINISTPPELLKGKIRYLDLEIDIVITDSEIYVVDEDEFIKKSKYMSPFLVSKVREIVTDLLNMYKQNRLV